MAVPREKLYEEIWVEPAMKVAARYGVSASFLTRICGRLKIPRPPRGYWTELKAGKNIQRPELPIPEPGDEIEWSREGNPKREPAPPLKLPDAGGRKKCRKARSTTHPMIAGTKEHFSAENAKLDYHDYVKPQKRLVPDIHVSQETRERALEAASELFRTLEDRGHRVTFAPRDQYYERPSDRRRMGTPCGYMMWGTWKPSRPTVVFIGTLAIGIILYEPQEKGEVLWEKDKYVRLDKTDPRKMKAWRNSQNWQKYQEIPSGRLSVYAYCPYPIASWEKSWEEKKPGDLLKWRHKIGRELEQEAETVIMLVEEGQAALKKKHEELDVQTRELEQQEAERRLQQAFKDSREQLLSLSENWALAHHLENFFESVTQNANKLEDPDRATILDRLERARKMFGGLDALRYFRAWKTPEER